MYIPPTFRGPEEARLFDLIDAHSFGTLIVPHEGGVEIAHLPFVLDRTAGPHGTLRCHVARANPIWRLAGEGRSVVAVFSGPHTYISPRWYARPSRQVPTWNYAVVHAHGRALAPMSTEEVRALLDDLTAENERGADAPWTLDSTEPGFVDGLLGGVVGLSVAIERLEGKLKLSQNRSLEDQARVRKELAARGGETDREMLRWMPPLDEPPS